MIEILKILQPTWLLTNEAMKLFGNIIIDGFMFHGAKPLPELGKLPFTAWSNEQKFGRVQSRT